MGDIYKESAGTITWLGKEADQSDKAMDLLESIPKLQINTNEDAAAYMATIHEIKKLNMGCGRR